MKNQWVIRASVVLLGLFQCGVLPNKSLIAQETFHPGLEVFEKLLDNNKVLLFGKVSRVNEKKTNKEDLSLKGFQYFNVVLNTEKVLSNQNINLKSTYEFEFGTMVDQQNVQTSMPIHAGESLLIVLDSYIPGKTHVLKDNLLQIYERYTDVEQGSEYFLSKITKNYSQKKLKTSDLYYFASGKGMVKESYFGDQKNIKVLSRGLASVDEQSEFKGSPEYSKSNYVKRTPNSSGRTNSEEELSVFSLLLVLIFLGTFSHFVIKYYDESHEEV